MMAVSGMTEEMGIVLLTFQTLPSFYGICVSVSGGF